MGILDKVKNFFLDQQEEEEDYFKIAEDFENAGQYVEAIGEYEKLIREVYAAKSKDYTHYINITTKIIGLYTKLGNYDKVIELWPKKYAAEEYGPKQKFELAMILENAGKIKEAMDVYNSEESKLQLKKIEFLMRQKKVDDANRECTRLLLSMRGNDPIIEIVWMLKGKILMSIRRWEEAESYFIKILERQSSNLEAKKLKIFCSKQVKR